MKRQKVSGISLPADGNRIACAALVLILAAVLAASAAAAERAPIELSAPNPDLLQLSLEDLGRVKVTTVSRKTESLATAAAAIHVIAQEDIRRSGAVSLPEALRMAPGLDVAQANARQWAISSRGFNDLFANKLLVLMDGRTVYTPAFSGVYWEDANTLLEDVDRIEVIRGPGATLWGANAVNGVINILTKSAKETQGTLITGGGGLEERGFGAVRYGGQLSSNVYYRAYAKYANRDEATLIGDGGAGDGWWTSQGGFRLDASPSGNNRLTLQGDYYYGQWGGTVRRHTLFPPGLFSDRFRAKSEGGNLLGRWTHDFGADSELSLQSYYDRTDREFGIGREIRDTLDLDGQHRFRIGERNEIVWGAAYRYSVDHISGSDDFRIDDPEVGLQWFSAFAQDELTLVPERLRVMAGTKLEHNDFTGFEVQPSGRIAWTPTERQTVWGAISRAVRTPSRAERGAHFYSDPPPSVPSLPLPYLIPASGNPEFGSEELVAYEIGYRARLHSRLSLDVAAFYNQYDHLYNVAQLPVGVAFSPSGQPYLNLSVTDNNALFGETYGAEVSILWQPLDVWRLGVHYAHLQMNLHTRGSVASLTEESEGDSPQHQVSIRSDVDLGRHWEWGLGLRFVDNLPAQRVQAYTELETRLAWTPTVHWELSIVGRNLLHAHHQEFSPFLFSSRDTEVDRAIFGKAVFRY